MTRKPKIKPPQPEATQLALGFESPPEVSYRLRRSVGAAGEAVKIKQQGDTLQVSAPAGMSLERIEDAVRSRIAQPGAAQMTPASGLPELPAVWAPGGVIRFLGRALTLKLDGAAPAAAEHDGELILPLPPDAEPSRIRDQACAWLQGQAQRVLTDTLHTLAGQEGLPPPTWRLSFSARVVAEFDKTQALRLNWKLVLLPPESIEHILLRVLRSAPKAPATAGLFD